MQKLTKWLAWIDDNLVKIFLIGFIFVMPLAPKLPITMVNHTFVGIRFDDFYISFLVVIFLIQILREKVDLKLKFLVPFLIFWVAVAASLLNGLYIQSTVDYQSLGFMHAARRVQYMAVFFIAMSAIQTKKDFYYYLNIVLAVLGIVAIYGIGQKVLGWPAIQTMNPEYAKGYILQLSADARISSTFAGHYDLAGYLVLLIPILIGMYFARKKVIHLIVFVLSVLSITLTSSRVSWGAYVLSTFPYILWMRKYVFLVCAIILTVSFTFLSNDLTTRITRTFQAKTVFVEKSTGRSHIAQEMRPDLLPAGDIAIGNRELEEASEEDIEIMRERIRADLRHRANAEGRELTPEEEEELIRQAMGNLVPVRKNLLDTSTAVRFEVSWPRAIDALKVNYILGSGPSSLGEATDGNYFRWLGEFGLLGTLAFLYILGSISLYVFWYAWKLNPKDKALYYGYLFGLGGIMINAIMIDIFEASKFAYTFWMISGLYVGSIYSITTGHHIKTDPHKEDHHKTVHSHKKHIKK